METKMNSHSPAMNRACAELEAQARKSTRAEIKHRARHYALAPAFLDTIISGLSGLSPRRVVECLEAYLDPPNWRHFGFGGEHPALSFRGALLYARYARAKSRQHVQWKRNQA
jgi:hypothetical protein